jgi:glycosyltransferase involved in cell wall biosynthesis
MSVLSQTADIQIEIIIGDDGTGEETPSIVEKLMMKYPNIIKYFRHKQNIGPSENCLFLIREARGHYIAHLDGDDFWLPGKIKAQLEWLTDNPDSAACYSNALVVNDEGEMCGVFGPVIRETLTLDFLLAKGNFLNHSSMLYRAKYKNSVTGLSGALIDYKMHLNFAQIAPIGYINAALTVYRLGSEHSMIRNTPITVQNLYFEAINLALLNYSVSTRVRRSALTHFWKAIALESIVKGRLKWAITWAKKISQLYPRESRRVLPLGISLALVELFFLVLNRTLGSFLSTSHLRILHKR